ncbi:MAG TPA: oligosaccharide flippase family protein, partial [Thermoanaerobaculia bacterium]|nr:oligosaccharide flippase family protein [Thermoanaerobaculia bacterium]
MKRVLTPIARNLFWLVLGDGFVKGAMVLVTVMVARALGASSVGVFSIAIGAVLVAIPLFSMGQVEVLIRDTAATPESAEALVGAAHRLQARALAFLLPLGLLIALLLRDQELKWTLLAFALYPVLRMRTVTIAAAFKGLDRMDVEVKARFFEMGLILVLVGIVAAAHGPVWTTGIAFCIGAAVSLGWIATRRHQLPRGDATSRSLDLLRAGLPFVGIAVGSQLLFRSDLFLAAAFAIPKDRIGLYGASATLIWGVLALPQLTALALYPTFSRLSAARRPSSISALAAAALG